MFDENEEEITHSTCGENARIRLRGVEEEVWTFCFSSSPMKEIAEGFVLCDARSPVKCASSFEAQLMILEHRNIICAGYAAVLHIHACVEEIVVTVVLDALTNSSRLCCIWWIKRRAGSRRSRRCLWNAVRLWLFGLKPLDLSVQKFTLTTNNWVDSHCAMREWLWLWAKSQSWLTWPSRVNRMNPRFSPLICLFLNLLFWWARVDGLCGFGLKVLRIIWGQKKRTIWS